MPNCQLNISGQIYTDKTHFRVDFSLRSWGGECGGGNTASERYGFLWWIMAINNKLQSCCDFKLVIAECSRWNVWSCDGSIVFEEYCVHANKVPVNPASCANKFSISPVTDFQVTRPWDYQCMKIVQNSMPGNVLKGRWQRYPLIVHPLRGVIHEGLIMNS